ncbi:MAG: Asp23/Gls24 family envelope stress response protein [Chloroflexi bacterium]|nr:Asp23/Gls24 family envelope stress response protein [Chloroflexota bacterium]
MAQSSVTVSPEVVRTVVRNTVLAMPSVRGLVGFGRRFSGRGSSGVDVQIVDGVVRVSLQIVAAADAALLELGGQIQNEVVDVVEEIVGMKVASVDVLFEDVKA